MKMSTRFRPRGFILVILTVSVRPHFWDHSYLSSPSNSAIRTETTSSSDTLDTFPLKKYISSCLRVAKTLKKRPKMGARKKTEDNFDALLNILAMAPSGRPDNYC